MSYGTAKLTSVIGFIPVLSILFTKYVKCFAILPGNWCKCVWFDMFKKNMSLSSIRSSSSGAPLQLGGFEEISGAKARIG